MTWALGHQAVIRLSSRCILVPHSVAFRSNQGRPSDAPPTPPRRRGAFSLHRREDDTSHSGFRRKQNGTNQRVSSYLRLKPPREVSKKLNMDTVRVELDVPRDLLGALNVTENELGPQLKAVIALALFRDGRISSGKAAELVGSTKAEFIDRLDRHGISYFTETPDEVKAQVAATRTALDRL